MANYVNEDKFFAWYEAGAREPKLGRGALLDDVLSQYSLTGVDSYVIPAGKTVSGLEERFPYDFKDIGCCGAGTICITF